MNSPSNIPPPKNWQDFEFLCLKLWGEIWEVPHEIEFNSDNSQGQQGVDIYAPTNGGTRYNGIQCKNKKLNLINGSPNRITITDIDQEIKKAEAFQPALNKLVIATSLPKDQRIEEYVRTRSASNAENGLFTIQICFWEFFERKLPEFQKVYDWYLKNEDFYRIRNISVTFEGGSEIFTYNPKLQKTITRFVERDINELFDDTNVVPSWLERATKELQRNPSSILGTTQFPLQQTLDWDQYCWLSLSIRNTGQAALEDLKIELEFEGDFEEVGASQGASIFNLHFRNDVKEYRNSKTHLYIQPYQSTLVPNDGFVTGRFFIRTKPGAGGDVRIQWELLSRDFSDSGSLCLKILPKFHVVINESYTYSEQKIADDVTYSLIKRPGMQTLEGVRFFDRESDYRFE